MLPGWDRLQDLRGGKYPAKKEPEAVKGDATARAVHGVTDQATINLNAERISAYAAGVKEGKKMSKLAEAAAGIAERKIAHDAKGDEWLRRLNAIKAREPEAFRIGDAVLDEREADLVDMENTMRQLSNLPNG